MVDFELSRMQLKRKWVGLSDDSAVAEFLADFFPPENVIEAESGRSLCGDSECADELQAALQTIREFDLGNP